MVRPKGSIMSVYIGCIRRNIRPGSGKVAPTMCGAMTRGHYTLRPLGLWLILEPDAVRPVEAEIGARLPVIEIPIRNIAQARIDRHRLRHFADQANGEDLVGVDFHHLAPGGSLVGIF